jgi:hypothetical protein
MDKKNAVMKSEFNNENDLESFDLEALENKINDNIEEELKDLDYLESEHEKIGNPDNLGDVVQNIVWEQFINQLGSIAGEDFIKANHGLTLDLRNEAHIQTPENFKDGKISKHNHYSRESLEQNYDRYKNMTHKEFRKKYVNKQMDSTLKRAGTLEKEGINTVQDIYTGKQIPTARKTVEGKDNPKAAQREHVKSSDELYRNPSLQMANDNEALASVINNPENLQGYTTAERNRSKSNKSVAEMDDKDKTKHHEKANKRAEEFINKKEKEGEERLKKEGRKTQKEEALRIGSSSLRAAVMALLAQLVKTIIGKLVTWFKSANKNLSTLRTSIKDAIVSFVTDLKTNLQIAGNSIISTIITSIGNPILNTIKKFWAILKQGWRALKDVYEYLKNPDNKSKPIDIRLMEIGKIVIVTLTAGGALLLGDLIEKKLSLIPVFSIEIPLIGSLASILGLFFGAVGAGIIGAILLNYIDKKIAKKQKGESNKNIIDKSNKVLSLQAEQQIINAVKLDNIKLTANQNITNRHEDAAEIMKQSMDSIMDNTIHPLALEDSIIIDEEDIKVTNQLNHINDELDKLL